MTKKPLICSICNKPIPSVRGWEFGNNAEPINSGRCCNDCDNSVVIPERIRRIIQARKAESHGR